MFVMYWSVETKAGSTSMGSWISSVGQIDHFLDGLRTGKYGLHTLTHTRVTLFIEDVQAISVVTDWF